MCSSDLLSACGDGRTYLPRVTPAGERMLDGYSVTYLYENEIGRASCRERV